MSNSEDETIFSAEEEISWCIKKLEKFIASDKLTVKSAKSTVIALKTLKSTKAPFIKKRQVMRMACGDYRKEMAEELKKTKTETKNNNILQVKGTSSGFISHKSKNAATSSESEKEKEETPFLFNFPQPTDEDSALTKVAKSN